MLVEVTGGPITIGILLFFHKAVAKFLLIQSSQSHSVTRVTQDHNVSVNAEISSHNSAQAIQLNKSNSISIVKYKEKVQMSPINYSQLTSLIYTILNMKFD